MLLAHVCGGEDLPTRRTGHIRNRSRPRYTYTGPIRVAMLNYFTMML